MTYFRQPADYFTLAVCLWIALYLFCNLLPQSLFLKYHSFQASDVCRDGEQVLTGVRWVPIRLEAEGVDRIYSYSLDEYVHRIEWSGAYEKGVSTSSWKEVVTEQPGLYRWDATHLTVRLPLWIKVSISGVKTNDFNVIACQ